MTAAISASQLIDLGGEDVLVRNLYTGATAAGQGTSRVSAIVAGGSTITLTSAHAGSQINLDTLTGTTATLPAATGTGNTYKFVVTVLATSNSHVITTNNANDYFIGSITSTLAGTPTTNNIWPANAIALDTDTITLNRTTTGSVMLGEWITCQDIATNVWLVNGIIAQSGTAATPFTDAV